jgi:DNA polymerase III epsilon subunit-like protein
MEVKPEKMVYFDIETTGFEWSDEITTIVLEDDRSSHLLLNNDYIDLGSLESTKSDYIRQKVEESVNSSDFDLRVHCGSESAILTRMKRFMNRVRNERKILCAYYAENKYRSAFDIPFVRTRAVRNDVGDVFRGVKYIELQDIVTNRFNTTVEGNEYNNSLDTAYDLFVGGDLSDADPFEDSYEAVKLAENGDIVPVAIHNFVDVEQTRLLSEKLVPMIHDGHVEPKPV